MIIYCDTSFLISYLNESDVHYATARAKASRLSADDFVICEVHLLELPAAVRAATHRNATALPAPIARRIINRFDRAVTGKIFLRKQLDMAETVAMARSLGETHGWHERHTAFGLWHIAAAWSLSAGAFLTLDQRQEKIALSLGMKI